MPYKWCKFGCDRSIIKDTTFRKNACSAVSRLPLGEFSWNFTPLTFHAYDTKIVSLVAIDQYLRVLYFTWKTKDLFACISASFGGISLELHTCVTKVQVLLHSVNITGTLLDEKVPFRVYLGFHWWDFSKTSNLALSMYLPQTIQFWFRLVTN